MLSGRKISFLYIVLGIFVMSTLAPSKTISQPVPSFQMQLTNEKSFSSNNLSRIKPLIIIYFAPDCEHCQVLMDTLFKKINQFKKAQIIMVTFKPLNEVVDFENHYSTHKYQNIISGTEVPVFFFRKYYQVENTPFTALYNAKGKLIVSYKKETPVDDLIKHLKQLYK